MLFGDTNLKAGELLFTEAAETEDGHLSEWKLCPFMLMKLLV